MNSNLQRFFEKNPDAFYINSKGERKFRGVNGRNACTDSTRNMKAAEQARLSPVPVETVISQINNFSRMLGAEDNGADSIELDNIKHDIIGRCIVARGCTWKHPRWDEQSKKYSVFDPKYTVIKEMFHTNSERDLVWLKFTKTGRVGVVAKSHDINFHADTSSGFLVEEVDESWDESFVLIYPLNSDVLKNCQSGDIELAIGNYLIAQGVPIVDFYSHNN